MSSNVGWTSSPNGRGTIDILWTCVSTLLICTWTVLHRNIPKDDEIRATWTEWPWWRKRLQTVGMMVLAITAPEMLVSFAVRDWLWARASITFLFWWSKPLDVEHRYTISCPSELRHDVRQLLDGLDISDYSESIRPAIRKKGRMPFLQFMDLEGRTTSEAADLILGSFAVAGTTFSAVQIAFEKQNLESRFGETAR